MNQLTLNPISTVSGEILLPGSKSLSNRILLISALAEGTTRICNLLDSDDVSHMLKALTNLGLSYELSSNKTVCKVHGNGGSFSNTEKELFLGNAGTAMRPLAATLCAGNGQYTLKGESRMYERPIGDLVNALKSLGCEIEYLQEHGYPPLRISANGINGGRVNILGNTSSQFLTALLMAAPLALEDMVINIVGELVSKPYIDITLHTMRLFNVQVENVDYRTFKIRGRQNYKSPGDIMVEGDASSASYFLSAGAIAGGSVRVNGIGNQSVQGDKRFAQVLGKMGAKIKYGSTYIEVENDGQLTAIDMDLNDIPDAAMTIATTALFAKGTTVIRNIGNWRVKETDRLFAMATELKKLGAQVDEGIDYISITPPANLPHAIIDTYDDHRIAMCFSLVALGNSPVTINDPECVKKTFPSYFEEFESISHL